MYTKPQIAALISFRNAVGEAVRGSRQPAQHPDGWGMIFCKRIMQSFGGSIQVSSVPGASTTIELNFPAARADRTAAQ